MGIFKNILRDDKNNIKDIPIYMTNASTLIRVAESKVRDRKFKEISMPHKSQVFVVNDDGSGTVAEAVIHVVDQPVTPEIQASLIVSGYFSFINDPSCNRIDPLRISVALTEDESDLACKCTFLKSNAAQIVRNKSAEDTDEMMGQYLYNTILGLDIALAHKDTITGEQVRSFKLDPSKKGKKAYSDISVTYINTRSYLKNSLSSSKGIAWDISFKVRGHWRYFSTAKIGVDRAGERGEYGRTWIKEYRKGHGELKEKIRVIK